MQNQQEYIDSGLKSKSADFQPYLLLSVHCSLSVRLSAPLSRATVTAQLGHLIGLLSLSQYTTAEGESIYRPSPLW